MDQTKRLRYLSWSLVAVGVIFIGAGAFTLFWPSGWVWQPHHLFYEQMIFGIYAVLGVFLLLAARDPLRHASLIWFTVWSSVVHGGIMAAQALTGPEHHGHLIGDVPALFIVAILLGVLMPRSAGAK